MEASTRCVGLVDISEQMPRFGIGYVLWRRLQHRPSIVASRLKTRLEGSLLGASCLDFLTDAASTLMLKGDVE
jgi:hypothetical protein